jgi:hypothetical protein
MVVGYL